MNHIQLAATSAYAYNLRGVIGFAAICVGWPTILWLITRSRKAKTHE